jgi:hypothetical protein
MHIQYLNSDLRELNLKLRSASANATGMSDEEVRHC